MDISRQIKFRYVFKHKVFKDVSLYHFTLEEVEKGALAEVLSSGMTENGYELVSKDQYIGRKDKKGKEIYERDIIEGGQNGHWRGVVKYENKDAAFYIHERWNKHFGNKIGPKGKEYDKSGAEYYFYQTYGYKVIGNIKENPELLKGEIK